MKRHMTTAVILALILPSVVSAYYQFPSCPTKQSCVKQVIPQPTLRTGSNVSKLIAGASLTEVSTTTQVAELQQQLSSLDSTTKPILSAYTRSPLMFSSYMSLLKIYSLQRSSLLSQIANIK